MRNICTFFGHRIVSEKTASALKAVLTELIENKNVRLFYVGNQGGFDSLARRTLIDLSHEFKFKFYVVLAYMPGEREKDFSDPEVETILPDGIETVPKRFAIDYRNKWMIENSNYVITYVHHDLGSGAAKFKKLAEKKNKVIIEL